MCVLLVVATPPIETPCGELIPECYRTITINCLTPRPLSPLFMISHIITAQTPHTTRGITLYYTKHCTMYNCMSYTTLGY